MQLKNKKVVRFIVCFVSMALLACLVFMVPVSAAHTQLYNVFTSSDYTVGEMIDILSAPYIHSDQYGVFDNWVLIKNTFYVNYWSQQRTSYRLISSPSPNVLKVVKMPDTDTGSRGVNVEIVNSSDFTYVFCGYVGRLASDTLFGSVFRVEDGIFDWGGGIGINKSSGYFVSAEVIFSGDVIIDGSSTEYVKYNDWSYDFYGYRKYNSTGNREYNYPGSLGGAYGASPLGGFDLPPSDARIVADAMTGQFDLYFRMEIHPNTGQTLESPDFQYFCEDLRLKVQISDDNGQSWGDPIKTWGLQTLFLPYHMTDHDAGFNNKMIKIRLNNQTAAYTRIKFIWCDSDENEIRVDEWKFTRYTGVVDENGDGIDDRTQLRDEDGNIISDGTGQVINPGGIGSGIADGDLSDYISQVRNVFSAMWGVIPGPVLAVIIGGIGLILVVGLIRVVTG